MPFSSIASKHFSPGMQILAWNYKFYIKNQSKIICSMQLQKMKINFAIHSRIGIKMHLSVLLSSKYKSNSLAEAFTEAATSSSPAEPQ